MPRADVLSCVEELESLKRLGEDDDRDLWIVALEILLNDTEYDISQGKKRAVWIHLGVCSHWLRPHQTRWTAAGGFAWPLGYGNGIGSRESLPQFDWSVYLSRNQLSQWQILSGIFGRRSTRTLDLRVAFPTRTAHHEEAVIHTVWSPGTPANPRQKRTRFYGFRHQLTGWELKATTPDSLDK